MTKTKIGKRELRQWVKALRSGDYEQAHNGLCQNKVDSFLEDAPPPEQQLHCCLGVACDLFLDAYWHEDDQGRWSIQGKEASRSHIVPEFRCFGM